MIELYIVLGAVAVFVGLFSLAAWLSRKLGEMEAKHRERMRERDTQKKLARMLARRNRNRVELVDWVRDNADDGSSVPSSKRRDG